MFAKKIIAPLNAGRGHKQRNQPILLLLAYGGMVCPCRNSLRLNAEPVAFRKTNSDGRLPTFFPDLKLGVTLRYVLAIPKNLARLKLMSILLVLL